MRRSMGAARRGGRRRERGELGERLPGGGRIGERLEGGEQDAEVVADEAGERDGIGAGDERGERGGERPLPGLAQPAEGARGLGALGGGERARRGEDARELRGRALAGAAQRAHGEEARVARRREARGRHLADAIDDGERDVLEPAHREERLRHAAARRRSRPRR